MGKSTISMAIFNSYVSHYQWVHATTCHSGETPGSELAQSHSRCPMVPHAASCSMVATGGGIVSDWLCHLHSVHQGCGCCGSSGDFRSGGKRDVGLFLASVASAESDTCGPRSTATKQHCYLHLVANTNICRPWSSCAALRSCLVLEVTEKPCLVDALSADCTRKIASWICMSCCATASTMPADTMPIYRDINHPQRKHRRVMKRLLLSKTIC